MWPTLAKGNPSTYSFSPNVHSIFFSFFPYMVVCILAKCHFTIKFLDKYIGYVSIHSTSP